MGNKQVNVTDTNLSMTNNLFFGQVDKDLKITTNKQFQNPNFITKA